MGHRFLSRGKLIVRNADFISFEKLLTRHHVILCVEKRIEKIRRYLKLHHHYDEDLVKTVAHLVEEPFGVKGSFPKQYLKLPRAVLEVSMSKQLKVFPCYNASGKLVNYFTAVINGKRKDTKKIAKNYENVLCSRLEDAQFFFNEDSKNKLELKEKGGS